MLNFINEQNIVKLVILLWTKYNSGIFKNNRSKNQDTSKIVRKSRKREQENIQTKEEAWTRETSKHVETRLEILQGLKYEGQERMVTGDEENEAENVGQSHELLDELFAKFDVSVGKL